HVFERLTGLGIGFGSDTIRRYDQLEFPHVGVVRGVHHADVGGEPCENQSAYFQELEKHFKGSGVKPRVLWFEHEVVINIREEQTCNFTAGGSRSDAPLDLFVEVALPASEIIVDVNDGHSRPAKTLPKRGYLSRRRNCRL